MNRSRRPWVWLCGLLAGALSLGACDSTTEIPLEPEGEIQINSIAINRNTIQPVEGTVLTAGTAGNAFNLDVFYQVTPEEFANADNAAWMSLWIETYDDEGSWAGDLVDRFFGASQPSGEISASGTFRAPATSPYCLPFSYLALAAQLWAEDPGDQQVSQPANEKAGGSSYDVIPVAQVTGTTGVDSPCLAFDAWIGQSGFWWGEPLWLVARNAPVTGETLLPGPASSVQFAVGTQPATTLLELAYDAEWSEFIIWLPPAPDGDVRMFASGQESAYGADLPMSITYAGGSDDVFETNDSFDEAEFDWASTEYLNSGQLDVLLWHPYLSLPAPDRDVDASGNPDGLTIYGAGDWFWLPVEADMDVCAWLYPSTGDDVDLLLYDEDGTFQVASTNAGDAPEFVRLNNVPANIGLSLWVAPYSMSTTYGIYSVAAGNCAAFGADPAGGLPQPLPAALDARAAADRAEANRPGMRSRWLRSRDGGIR